jgi:hypothetical protein
VRALPRRAFLRAAAVAPLAVLARPGEATEYASALEVLDTVDRLSADVASRLRALKARLPAARAFARSVLADQERHRAARARLRRRLRLAPGAAVPAAGSVDVSLEDLRAAQQELVHAHAEGLPAIGDPYSVDVLARHMVDLARHLAVIDLWIEAEA